MDVENWSLDDEDLVPLTRAQRVARAIDKLPKLSLEEIPSPEDSCPICLNPFTAIYAGEVQNEGTATLSGVVAPKLVDMSGLTRLEGCGHVFCRVDLIEWIRGSHGTCPACRHTFADIRPITESDGESSDGDYVPEDDEDDGFTDEDMDDWGMDTDPMEPFTDAEDEEEVDVELDAWEDSEEGMENLGLSDGDSMSEGDLAMVSGDEGVSLDNGHASARRRGR
ncbi:hypothetical protein BC629DRAFT_1440340 [Irpex lacteus]|nr:hypothetical protein BC629DRAFT_1440340 [Irpex lacteus]